MIAVIVLLIGLAATAVYFFIRWFFSPERVAIRQARRAARRKKREAKKNG